jgi:hypothetical protein
MNASAINAVALDYGGYAATFAVSQLSLRVTVSSVCSPAPPPWNLGSLGKVLSGFQGTGDVSASTQRLLRRTGHSRGNCP